MSGDLKERARATIARHQMLLPGQRVLVAVSGGADSTALLVALAELAADLAVQVCAAHLNHGLRGEESLRDEHAVIALAARLGIGLSVGRIDLSSTQANLEQRAREARYSFLETTARQQGCARIATGHTRDDQVETVLMRVMRGTGIDGLAGIPAVRGPIIRPLLPCTRAEVVSFLTQRGLAWCDDSSNDDRRFLRNRVRHDVLPLLESLTPGIRERLAASAALAQAEARQLDDVLAPMLVKGLRTDGSLQLEALAAVAPALRGRFIRLWLRQCRGHLRELAVSHIAAIEKIALGTRPNAIAQLPGGAAVMREYDSLRFCAAAGAVPITPQKLVAGASLTLPGGWHLRAFAAREGAVAIAGLWHFVGDAERLPGSLMVRAPRPGDRVRPLGMRGRKKLQDVFVDRKVPREKRRTIPAIEADGEIVWVPGVVRSNQALVSTGTARTLCIVAEEVGIAGA